MTFHKNNCIEVQYSDGKRFVIRRDMITAITGDSESTTIIFQNGTCQIEQPVEQVLAVFGYSDVSEPAAI